MGKIAHSEQSKSNACRSLHTLLKRKKGLALPINIEVFPLTIRKRRPVEVLKVWWPMISMHEWVKYFFNHNPKLILGGHELWDSAGFEAMFLSFWETYRREDPEHEVYERGFPLQHCIPVMVHGDEGRGYCRIPLLVLSLQPVISFRGPDCQTDAACPR